MGKIKVTDRLSSFGIGGIVVADHEAGSWVKQSDFPKLLNVAIQQLDVTYIDTARGYDLAEATIGAWLKTQPENVRARIEVGTKVSISRLKEPADLENHFATSLATSLATLELERVSILWLHAPNPIIPLERIVSCMNHAVQSGKANRYGFSNVSRADLESIFEICERLKLLKPSAVQNEFNLLSARAAKPVLEFCRQSELQFFAFSPLASGLLAGRYPAIDEFPSDSRWAGWRASRALPDYWTEETFANLKQMSALAKKYGVSSAAVALRWCLEQPDVGVTLLGPRTLAHLEAAQEARSLSFAVEDVKFLNACFA